MAVVPAAEGSAGFAALTIGFLALCGAIVAFGMVKILYGVSVAVGGAVGWIVGHIPVVNKIVETPINDVFHWMEHTFSEAALGLEGSIAFWWHQLGDLTHWMGKELRAQAHLLYVLATRTIPHAVITGIRADIADGRTLVRVVGHTAENALHRGLALDLSLGQRIAAGVHDVIRPWEHTLDVTIPRDIAGLRARTGAITDRLDALWHRIRGVEKLTATAAFAGAVAFALTRLDLGWLRCRNVRNVGRALCGFPSTLLEAFLLDGLTVLAATDLCELSYAITGVAEGFEPVLYEFVDVEQALVGCHGNTSPGNRSLPKLNLPPVQTQYALGL